MDPLSFFNSSEMESLHTMPSDQTHFEALEIAPSKQETMTSVDRGSTGYSDISTLCQAKDFLSLTDSDEAAHQYWIKYIPRKHPVTGVDVQTTCAGPQRLKHRGLLTHTISAASILTGVMVVFSHFRDQVYAPVPQMIQIYYSLLAFASILLSCSVGSILSVSIDKWRGRLPPFIRRMDIVFILTCGQWYVIRMICISNQGYFWPMVSNVLQALITQIFTLAFAGGDVFNSYVALITSLGAWYSVIPILIGTAFSATYLHGIIGRICFYPAEYDKVQPLVVAGKPGCYVVGAVGTGCIHRMKESAYAQDGRWEDLEQNNYHYQFEIPPAGWQAASIKERFDHTRNSQMYMLTDGTTEDIQRTMRWAISTNECIYMQGYLECGLCACSMAKLLRCNIVVVQRSGLRKKGKHSKTKATARRFAWLFIPWKRNY